MNIARCYNPELIRDMIGSVDLDVEAWLAAEENVALIDADTGSVSMFEYLAPEVYTGHYFFSHQARGRKALDLGKAMLETAFGFAKVIRGMTPLQKRAARWASRQLGFKSYGVIFPVEGPCELFMQTRDEFFSQKE